MPNYEYVCEKEHRVIQSRKVDDRDVPSTCSAPLCDSPLKRVYTTPAISFKGSGFYSTGG